MFAFFDGIVAFIQTIVAFVMNLFSLLLTVVENIIRAVAWLFLCLGYLPSWLTAFITVPIALAVVFQVLNKGD